jgi:hypothetical protein
MHYRYGARGFRFCTFQAYPVTGLELKYVYSWLLGKDIYHQRNGYRYKPPCRMFIFSDLLGCARCPTAQFCRGPKWLRITFVVVKLLLSRDVTNWSKAKLYKARRKCSTRSKSVAYCMWEGVEMSVNSFIHRSSGHMSQLCNRSNR